MRIPSVVTKCKAMAAGAVALMATSTVGDYDWLARWALLMSVLAAGMCITAAIREATDVVKAYIKRWVHETFENGFRAGVETGREMEVSERFIAASRGTEDRPQAGQ